MDSLYHECICTKKKKLAHKILNDEVFYCISYNGKNYHGWQIQKNAVTVQSTIQDVISKILGKALILLEVEGLILVIR